MRIENTSLSQPIQPGLLAQNTSRNTGMRGVGFLPIQMLPSRGLGGIPIIDSVIGLFSTFGKDPEKSDFDLQRQALWERFASVVNMKDSYAGTIDRQQLQRFIGNVQSIIAEHDALYNQFRSQIDTAWINPRYNDYNSFFKKVLDSWQQELSTMGGGLLEDIPTKLAEMDLTTMLLIGGAAFLLFRKGR
jgi:hypothetical protein